MKIFDIFKKTERDLLPIAFYAENKVMGKLADEKDFPTEYFENIILMTKRLHKMGVYPEKEIVRFSIPKILEMLESGGVLSGVSLSTLDTAQVIFGENYAGWWYKDEKQNPPSLYMVPFQLVFYHSKKPYNYFLSLTKEGLDLRQNKVSVTNVHDVANNINKTECINLGIKGMAELKSAYHLLFTHLKYQMLLKMSKLGYLSFIDKMASYYSPSESKADFIAYAKQYFALNTEKMDEYPLARDKKLFFGDFFYTLLAKKSIGMVLERHSFADIIKWLEERTGVIFDAKRMYSDHFDLLCHALDIIRPKGYYLWFLLKDETLADTMILLTQEKEISKIGANLGFELVPFSEDLMTRYSGEISHEKEIRTIAREFYSAIGVHDLDGMMMSIVGTKVLDWQLYKNNYLIFSDDDNDINIKYMLCELFSKHGLPDLIEKYSNNGLTLDEIFFQDHEDINPYDRIILYADPIRTEGKLLFSLETGDYDYYQFGIIEDTPEAKARLAASMNQLIECGELERYVLFDTGEKRLFKNLLFGVNWILEDKNLFMEGDAREKFYRENSDSMTRKQADEYLARVSLIRSEMTICIESHDGKEFDFTIKADNGKYFTNLNLLLKIQQKIYENKDFRDFFMGGEISIWGLRLSVNREKYYLLCDSSI